MSFCWNEREHEEEGRRDFERRGSFGYNRDRYNSMFPNDCDDAYRRGFENARRHEETLRQEEEQRAEDQRRAAARQREIEQEWEMAARYESEQYPPEEYPDEEQPPEEQGTQATE